MARLKLERPIVFFDLEATGLNLTQDRIVEISYIKIMPHGEEMSRTIRLNPEMPIPAEATAVHGIADEDVADCPTFKDIAGRLKEDFGNADLAGFNSNRFDIPLLAEEFLRAGIDDMDFSRRRFVDVQTIFHKKEQRNLTAAYKFYCGKDLTEAHTAAADTRATYEVLLAQLDRYPDLENNVAYLAEYSSYTRNADLAGRFVYDDKRQIVVNFGKYRGKLLTEVLANDPGYYSWMISNDFALDTKRVLTATYLGMRQK